MYVMFQINSDVGYKFFEWLHESTSTNRKLFGLSTSKFIQALSVSRSGILTICSFCCQVNWTL
ncbi:CLUMA_CG005090, isoform A [Clunio marinus]|uniref:CLUMA_CG005090, isoform A n=1 Tax=Clunio marinus TaxID=568069 RepID=A0A1J1HZ68_9DIPT|nr:CLUMA_CG005090, isoform A [Clunio marinus]